MHALLPLLLLASQAPLTRIADLGTRLDPAGPRPDLECLQELARLARPLRAADLRWVAGRLGTGHPGRACAVLASAWARDLDEPHERWLIAVALAGNARAGQAAVHALDLAGRWRALHAVVELGLDRDDALARTGLALDALPTETPATLASWRARARELPRVSGAFTELAERTRPRDTASLIAELEACGGWERRAVWRRLVTRADGLARSRLREGLEREGPGARAGVLAALVSWRPLPGTSPPPGLDQLLVELEGDAEAHARLRESLADRKERWALRRARDHRRPEEEQTHLEGDAESDLSKRDGRR